MMALLTPLGMKSDCSGHIKDGQQRRTYGVEVECLGALRSVRPDGRPTRGIMIVAASDVGR